jgi:hypothetical protein
VVSTQSTTPQGYLFFFFFFDVFERDGRIT